MNLKEIKQNNLLLAQTSADNLFQTLEFLHRNELAAIYGLAGHPLPAVLIRRDAELQLVAGADEIDACRDMDALKDKPGVVRIIEPEYRTFSIKMNTRHGPMADLELRKAVSYAVNYKGILPDLFKEGKGVVAQGTLGEGGVFTAKEVLAKHDENYMPPEAQHAMDQAAAAKAAKSLKGTP